MIFEKTFIECLLYISLCSKTGKFKKHESLCFSGSGSQNNEVIGNYFLPPLVDLDEPREYLPGKSPETVGPAEEVNRLLACGARKIAKEGSSCCG